MAIAGFFVVGLGLAILAPLSFAALAGAVPAASLDVAIARMNIANYLGAILGGGLIGAAASADHLRWAFVIPLVLIPIVLLFARSFRTAMLGDRRGVGCDSLASSAPGLDWSGVLRRDLHRRRREHCRHISRPTVLGG